MTKPWTPPLWHHVRCAYCGVRRAVNRDHVVPKSLAKRYDLPDELRATVPACFECNIRKGTRKLIPRSWESKIPELKALIPGHWRVWTGDVKEEAFTAMHI